MNRLVLVLAVLGLVAAPLALAAEMQQKAQGPFAPPALEPLKKLAGTWTGKAGADHPEMDVTVVYRVTANGSAVMETLFPDTDHEMVTMYTVEKGGVVLTHYCAAGNQPRMRAKKGGPPNELVFQFAGGANLDPARDEFMHDARLVFVDENHLRSEWTGWEGGKAGKTTVFDLTRQK